MTRTRERREQTHRDRQERRARKREEMLEAAIRVVRRDGATVSMDEIAAEAGVTKPIVYRAFGDREGLTAAVATRFADELAASLQKAIASASDPRERVRAAIDAYVFFIEQEPEIVRFLVHRAIAAEGGSIPGFVNRLGQIVTRAIGDALREQGLDSGAAEPWAYAIVGAVHLAGDWWLDRKTMPREQLVSYLTALFWDGMPRYETLAPGGSEAGMDTMNTEQGSV